MFITLPCIKDHSETSEPPHLTFLSINKPPRSKKLCRPASRLLCQSYPTKVGQRTPRISISPFLNQNGSSFLSCSSFGDMLRGVPAVLVFGTAILVSPIPFVRFCALHEDDCRIRSLRLDGVRVCVSSAQKRGQCCRSHAVSALHS